MEKMYMYLIWIWQLHILFCSVFFPPLNRLALIITKKSHLLQSMLKLLEVIFFIIYYH